MNEITALEEVYGPCAEKLPVITFLPDEEIQTRKSILGLGNWPIGRGWMEGTSDFKNKLAT
jgi:hypothetical protein